MRYRSVCTGIAAETVAWHPLGWTVLSFSEIDPFCSALLKIRYPEVHNFGDFTKIEKQAERTDLLMGGTPCQSFSIAGKRAGLDDPRGNLALEFARLALRLRPRWLVWENVKGVLSSDGGRTFETFLGALAQCGYGFAYRVLDAQFDALAQRRERVFVVGYLGDWRPPAAVLFERESLRRDTAPGRKAGEEVATTIGRHAGGGPGQEIDNHGAYVSMALNAHGGAGRMDGESETFVVAPLTSANHHGDHVDRDSQLVVETLRSHPRPGSNTVGTIAFDSKQSGNDAGELAPTLRATPHDKSHANGGGGIAVFVNPRILRNSESSNQVGIKEDGLHDALCSDGPGAILTTSAVRRLTPKEWERLMGFEDDYTLIPYPRKKLAADGPRYKAIGNSISVPTLRWIGRRIERCDSLMTELIGELRKGSASGTAQDSRSTTKRAY